MRARTAGPNRWERLRITGERAAVRIDVIVPEHAQTRAEFGHHGAQVGHASILPRPGCIRAGRYSLKRGVSCNSIGPASTSIGLVNSVLS